ncbi:Uncharacterized conserved protein YloU, alkaline shock protein (Asp23) family [Proteiniborus ethanoligenes]|uniref:Uncharacterized conserved protein YloU, alkaline shock protein (Asp23) family n=1 Tax=Proteiniborus ethanoligenes TaxID=415015 RepID=A0A1H3K9Z7_9FIRM|nr:Asp23/Gls24 family envelope stress response protein [Proteiniborus ethanoligenes]TAH63408.1 MAG: Asp23/Gls24 family envelope stress response protein [Gottschalkiaceae bacterium]SDY48408.1 Uncharacterized conserved protein YloU, alkaline shock protein (Asp23) family [Proteiniborus ethanoligenes]
MSNNKGNIDEIADYGQIKISDEVVGIIASLAATEVKGVAGMSGGIAGGLSEILGRKNFSKGVKVEVENKEAIVSLYIIVEYGAKIPEVAWNIQESVKSAIETMTGLNVVEVNINIQGVNIEKEQKEE